MSSTVTSLLGLEQGLNPRVGEVAGQRTARSRCPP